MTQRKLTITHLYPEDMNLYGDLGNVLTLQRRAEWRGIQVEIINVGLGETLPEKTDIYFFGGGQDHDQLRVYKDLSATKKAKLTADINSGVVMLAICGGYQLLGEYFLDPQGNRIEGIGVLPLETVSPGAGMDNRAVGNLVTDISEYEVICDHYSGLNTLVGFENHSGRTRFRSKEITPLGQVRYGSGDNEDKVSDGAVYKNTFGSYMHGSLLPKNPHLADHLLLTAMKRRYDDYKDSEFKQLADDEEIAAHSYMLKKCNIV